MKLCAFRCLISGLHKKYNFDEVSKSSLWKMSSFYMYASSDGAVSHNVLYYQQFPVTRYQVRFNANNYVE